MAVVSEPPRKSTLRIEIAPRTLFWVLGLAALVWVAFRLTTVLVVITVALVLVGTLDPAVSWLVRRGVRRGRALALTFLVLALAMCGVLLLTVPPLVAQLLHMVAEAPAARDQFVAEMQGRDWARPLVHTAQSLPLDRLADKAGPHLIGYSSALLAFIGYALSALFLAIYLLADPFRSQGMLFAVVPRQHHVKLARILLELKTIVGGYMRGQLITSAAITAFVFVFLTAFGVEDALPIALFAGLTDIIPFVGGYIASTPVVLAVANRGTTAIIIAVLAMLVYQEIESRVLVPRVYGRVLRLPPAIVVVALLVGGTLMGVVGALLALPIAAGLQMVLRELRVDLPGDATAHDAERMRDKEIEVLYSRLAEGAPAADAAVIAGQLAQHEKANPAPPDAEPPPQPTHEDLLPAKP